MLMSGMDTVRRGTARSTTRRDMIRGWGRILRTGTAFAARMSEDTRKVTGSVSSTLKMRGSGRV